MHHVLDNIIWTSLIGDKRLHAVGSGSVRRFADGFSALVGFEVPEDPDLDLLRRYCQPGESFYCACWSGECPEGWSNEAETTMFKMVWDGIAPPKVDDDQMVKLQAEHAQAALDLAILTNPGPFGLRTMELGDYYGYFDGGKLIAMSGERMSALPYREVSGVCTHADHQGRGMARKLINKLVADELARGEIPFLHVLSANETARRLYESIGFRDYLEVAVRVIRRA